MRHEKQTPRRFVVRPCDNLGTVSGLKRDRTWSVWDTRKDIEVADHDRRQDARDDAKARNAGDAR